MNNLFYNFIKPSQSIIQTKMETSIYHIPDVKQILDYEKPMEMPKQLNIRTRMFSSNYNLNSGVVTGPKHCNGKEEFDTVDELLQNNEYNKITRADWRQYNSYISECWQIISNESVYNLKKYVYKFATFLE